jgi:arginine decarboxylase
MEKLIVGNRIPKDYFITSGAGFSDVDQHTGSFHLALKDAGIEMCNIMRYSSILPSISNKLNKPFPITHGEVAECIIAEANGEKGDIITAGIIYAMLYDKETQTKFGGLVCERGGNFTEKEIKFELFKSIFELYKNGYEEKYNLIDFEINIKSNIGTKKFNTVLVALVFQSYEINIIN